MNIFKKAIKEVEELDKACEVTPTEPEEEWVWVEGYKGTGKNMCCREFQYELNRQFDMPEDVNIEECENGFHLCLNLHDVFGYYKIGNGHRFFKVKALVRKSDKEKYGKFINDELGWYIGKYDKIVAKSIIFISELTIDEVSSYGITQREFEVILLIKRGLTNKEIASELSISVNTVNNHIANIFDKTDVRSRIDLLNLLQEAKW